ncbi:hypothetical protein HDC92_000070 [Pedobacter sp. AK017]|uniref:head GIN domain-containing protein n=1 Tax=Pedobacter sp. AK017 TaxID=2723073 RepID=UPI00160C7C4F|nr:head GIN domain-containing protein [Pedobacter sp. AK017]MBB5436406.1 hypothetical protein [Pedobacter sp. AK017]
MRILTLITLLGILFTGCSKDKLSASGDKITEERNPGDFNGISTSGSNSVYITYGTEFKVVLKGSNNLIPYFKTSVTGNTLYLGYEKASVQHDDVEVFVTLPSIRKVSISGSGKTLLQGSFPRAIDFKLSISGSGNATVQDAFDSDEVLVQISGSGKADLQQINARKAQIDISGSGDAKLKVEEKLKARISGSGKIYYTGNPDVDADVSGSGKVIKF